MNLNYLMHLREAPYTYPLKRIREKLAKSFLSQHRNIIKCIIIFFLFLYFDFDNAQATSSQLSQKPFSEHIYAVEINTQEVGESTFFLEDAQGKMYASEEDLEKWGFHLPKNGPTLFNNKAYYSLSEYKDLLYTVDRKKLDIHITSPSSHFKPRTLDLGSHTFVTPEKSHLGGYLDYDLLAQKNKYSEQLAGLFTAGLFNSMGTGFCDFLARHHTHQHKNHHSGKQEFVRLNSNFQHDIPEKLQTIIIGDSYTDAGMWGNSVGFAGLQFQTNFGTQPTFITFPLPSARGDAVVPSVVDLYLNDALIQQKRNDAGPFSINSIPVTTGAGNINLVTTDLLGRQQQVSIPYYASSSLLKPGLQDFSYSAGFLRKDFGIKSNEYSRFAFVGDHAVGITDTFTGETRLELLEEHQTAGLGGNYLISRLGVFNLAGATSYNSKKAGELIATGFQRQANQGVNFGANIQWMSKQFVQLGTRRKRSPRYLLTTFVGFIPYDTASLSFSYLRQENRKGPNASLLTINFSQVISHAVSMNISGMTNVRGRRNQSIFLTLTYAFNSSTTFNAIGTAQKNGNQGTAQLTRNLPAGPGYGYNVYAANGQEKNYQASLTGQNEIGTYTAASSYQGGVTTGQLQAQGSIALLNNSAYLSRELGQSFAVVNVPGYSDVSIYSQNQYMGRTDEDGTLLVPGLLPYQKNPLRVELQDLPLDAQVSAAEMNPIPYYLSGLVVEFPIKPSYGAIMKLVLPSGEPVPVGAVVTMNDKQFPIGYDGQLYLTGLEENNLLDVLSKNENYTCAFQYKRTDEPIPDLGTIQCQ